MPRIEFIWLNKTKPESNYLQAHHKRIYSQFGEEGILERCFEIMGEQNKWCVEFGAWDGIHLSNTCYFIKEKKWSAVQIEGNAKKFEVLKQNFIEFTSALQMLEIVGYTKGKNTIDDILQKTIIPINFDFISIDIDGNDWYVWESMVIYRPRLVIIEFNSTVPNDVIFVQDQDMSVSQGCSLAALIDLGRVKGYELICVHKVNAYFVVEEEFKKFNISDNSIDAMHANSRGRIWSGFDGTVFNTLGRLGWAGNGRAIDVLEYQSLTQPLRKFRDKEELSKHSNSRPKKEI